MTCKHCNHVVGQVYTITLDGCFTCGDTHSGIKVSASYLGLIGGGRPHKYALVNPVRCRACGKRIGYCLSLCGEENRESSTHPKRVRRPSLAERLFGAKVKKKEDADV
jgi:DNA-directed RNA polymerase subunit N (RpoN/RPB10)